MVEIPHPPLLAAAALALLAACAPAELTPAGARVEVARAPRAACQRVGAVDAWAGYNGRSAETNAAAVETALRNDAATKAADTLVITSRRLGAPQGNDALSRPSGATSSGGCPNCISMTADAYRCPAPVAAPQSAATPAPVEPATTFSEPTGEAALAAAVESARQCGATGEARLRVTFATTGDVVYAEAEGEGFAGTAAGACVARKLRNAHVPAFTGEARSLSRTVILKPAETPR